MDQSEPQYSEITKQSEQITQQIQTIMGEGKIEDAMEKDTGFEWQVLDYPIGEYHVPVLWTEYNSKGSRLRIPWCAAVLAYMAALDGTGAPNVTLSHSPLVNTTQQSQKLIQELSTISRQMNKDLSLMDQELPGTLVGISLFGSKSNPLYLLSKAFLDAYLRQTSRPDLDIHVQPFDGITAETYKTINPNNPVPAVIANRFLNRERKLTQPNFVDGATRVLTTLQRVRKDTRSTSPLDVPMVLKSWQELGISEEYLTEVMQNLGEKINLES